MATLTNPKTFKGILQVKSLPTNPEKGYIYLVGDGSQGGNGTGIYFGSRYYGKTENSAEIIALKNDITANTKSISDIEAVLGEWQASLGTVATAVVAVSGATETNATNITNLSTTVANNLTATTKAINDAKSEAINTATGYTNTQINEVIELINDKNVDAEGDNYITATADKNKVTVAATTVLTNAIDKANSAVQTIAEGDTNGTIKVDGTDVAVKGLGSAAYTDSSAYDESGAADNALKSATGYTESAVTTVKNTFNAYTGATDTVLSGLRSDINSNTNKLNAILEGSGVTEAIDSFIELQEWIEQHGTEVCGITSSITENKNAISAVNNTFNTYTGATDTVLSDLRGDINNVSSTSVNNSTAITNLTNNKLDTTAHAAYTAATKTTLENIESRLTAITNNAVISVTSSGNTITTSNTDGTVNVDVNTLAVETAQNNGYIAIKNDNGALYGVMYYGGDDAE